MVSRANEGAHVHLPKPSRGLNAAYLTGHCSILLVFINHAHETALSAEPIVDKEFYQMRDQSAPLNATYFAAAASNIAGLRYLRKQLLTLI